MNSGKPTRSPISSSSNGALYRAATSGNFSAMCSNCAIGVGTLCGINQVSGTFSPRRSIAQYAECFSIDWNVNGLFKR